MPKTTYETLTLILGLGLISSLALAENTLPLPLTTQNSQIAIAGSPLADNQLTSLTKDQWLQALIPSLPALICSGFIQNPMLKARMDEHKISYRECVSAIPAIATQCQNQYYTAIPDIIDHVSDIQWRRTLGGCIGENYEKEYL